ncbi:MAG: thioredoxin [Candidatus Magnetoovum sp. WYHC-5]|nr:thioredoxin [Candidatus Magnetoovum sp. WYHC-5]
MAEGVYNATTETWEAEVLKESGLVLVDFWAVWCGPCRMVAPIIEELAKEYTGKVKFVKLNTDENPDIASKYKIMGIPTLMFFRNGEKVDQLVGAVPKPQLKDRIENILG